MHGYERYSLALQRKVVSRTVFSRTVAAEYSPGWSTAQPGEDAAPQPKPPQGTTERLCAVLLARRLVLSVFLAVATALAGACNAPRVGHDPLLVERLGEILHRLDHTGATVTARVVVLSSGDGEAGPWELYAENIDEPFTPASNMKLVTSSVGLDLFGPDHTFDTYLAYDGENLWLLGTGDPAIGDAPIARTRDDNTTSVLEQWADALLARGITHIPGDLFYYDGALDAWTTHPSWDHDDLAHWYAAPVSGLNFNDNCVDITVFPTADGQPVGFEVVPPVADIVVINECVSGDDARPTISKMAFADVFVLGGGCTKRRTLKSKPMIDPGAFFADALRWHLSGRGIVIEGATKSVAMPLDGKMPPRPDRIVAVHRSTMHDVLWRINQSSQNLFAECMRKLAGRRYDALQERNVSGSWASGERATRAFLRDSGIDDTKLVADDGSGLSRKNKVTARLITDILAVMFRHPHAEAFRSSLAEPGKTGTLRSRMKDLTGHVFAKTGYIRGVRALSGYVHTHTGHWLCFSIIFNDIPSSVRPFNRLQDEACRLLVDWPNLPKGPESQPAKGERQPAPPEGHRDSTHRL